MIFRISTVLATERHLVHPIELAVRFSTWDGASRDRLEVCRREGLEARGAG
jgi:hypothetical protein